MCVHFNYIRLKALMGKQDCKSLHVRKVISINKKDHHSFTYGSTIIICSLKIFANETTIQSFILLRVGGILSLNDCHVNSKH